MHKQITFDSFIRGLIAILVVCGALYLIDMLSGVLLPFFIAWLLAYLLYPVVTFFQYKCRLRNRALSIFVVMLLSFVVIALVVWGLVPPLIDEFVKVKSLLAEYFVVGSRSADVPGTVANFIKEHVNMEEVARALDTDKVAELVKSGLPRIWNILTQSVNVLFSVIASFIVLLYMFFILLDYESISRGWVRFIPARHREFCEQMVSDVKDGMNRYFRGQALIAGIVGVLFSIGFLIIDFPLAIGFGLFIGFLNLIPYMQLISIFPAILLALLKAADTGQNFWFILLCMTIVYCVVQTLQDMVITPRVMGRAMGLNPAIILLSLSVWGSLMGIIGMIIALPLTTLLLSYYKRYIVKN